MYNVWQNVLAEIEQKLSSANFSTWFQDTSIISTENGHVIIGVKNTFYVKQLRVKYFDLIKTTLENNNIEVKSLDFEVKEKTKAKVKPAEVTNSITKEKLKTLRSSTKPISKTSQPTESGLNPNYTIENFVIGSNNDLAVSAAKSVIENPGKTYNPLFLYGGPGLGKTHLIQAIGNELARRNPDFKILYSPISDFIAEFVNFVLKGKGKEFTDKFRNLDCLIIDDFQFIVKKEKTQEEFFNLFNTLHQHGKQIIVTSDRLPSQIKTVDERLASRLTWAGAFDLQLPKFEEKCAILKAKAEFLGADIEPEAIEYIAENVNTNIRDLEGQLNTILLLSDVRGLTPLEVIQNGFVNISESNRTRPVSAKQIVDKVAKYYNLTVKEMCGKSRVANIKNARQVTMFILSKELNLSTNKIAPEVGVKDHTTVMHGIKKVEEALKLDFTLRDEIEEIKERIYG